MKRYAKIHVTTDFEANFFEKKNGTVFRYANKKWT